MECYPGSMSVPCVTYSRHCLAGRASIKGCSPRGEGGREDTKRWKHEEMRIAMRIEMRISIS